MTIFFPNCVVSSTNLIKKVLCQTAQTSSVRLVKQDWNGLPVYGELNLNRFSEIRLNLEYVRNTIKIMPGKNLLNKEKKTAAPYKRFENLLTGPI